MNRILSTAFLSAVFACISYQSKAQGCVAIRSTGAPSCMLEHPETGQESRSDKWIFNTGARYFKSYKHFKGSEEQKERVLNGTEVINHQTAFDFSLTRLLDKHWSVMVDVPLLINSRSSLYEHGLVNGVNNYNQRHSMHSYGLGDIRIAVYRWLLDPEKHKMGNI